MKKNFTLLMLAILFGISNVFADDCFKPLDATKNLAPDPGFDDISMMGGWDNSADKINKGITSHPDSAYCGSTGYVKGTEDASYDMNLLWEANTGYYVRVMLCSYEETFKIGVHGIGKGDVTKKPTTLGKWEQVEFYFVSGEEPSTTLTSSGVHFNATQGLFDNLEVYKWSATAINLMELLNQAKDLYKADGIGAADLKAKMDAAESLLAELNLSNLEGKEQALSSSYDNLKEEIYIYKNNNPDAEGFLDISDREDIKGLNLSFESDFGSIWTNNGFQRQNNTAFTLKEGTYYCEKWTSAGSTDPTVEGTVLLNNASIYQTANIPNGVYRLTISAQAINQNNAETVCNGVYFFANDKKTEISLPGEYTVTASVFNGTIKLGIEIIETAANYVAFDNIRLGFRDLTPKEASDALEALYAEVADYAEITAQFLFAKDIESEFLAVEAKYEEIMTGGQPTLGYINEVIAELAAVYDKMKESATAYAELNTLIAKANGMYNASKPAADILKTQLDKANDMYTKLEADLEDVNKMSSELAYAIMRFETGTVSGTSPIDATEWLKNPSFEEQLAGWTNNGFQTQNNTGLASKVDTYYCEKWVSAGNKLPNAEIYQEVQVPNGTYSISFVAFATQNGVGSTGAYCYVNDTEFEFGDESAYLFDAVVTNKVLKIGVKTVSTEANWVAFDNFALEYKGYDSDVIAASLKAKFDSAKELYFGKPMKSDLTSKFNALIAEVENALASKKEPDLDAASINLTALIPLMKESVDAYASLATALDKANKMKLTGSNDLATFTAAIAKAQAVYDGKSADKEEIETAVTELNAAMEAFNKLNPSAEFPLDVTADYLVNADFETEVKTGESHTSAMGWEYKSEDTFSWANNSNFSGKSGSRYLEKWVSPTDYDGEESKRLPYLEMVQSVENLPSGIYSLEVAAQAIIQRDPIETGSGFIIYMNGEEKEVGFADTYTFEDFEITDGKLTVGFKTADPLANWISIDNFRLYFKGAKTGIEEITPEIPFIAYMNGDLLNVKFNLSNVSDVNISLYNIQGMLLSKQSGTYGVGENTISLNTNLKSGIYLIQLNCNGQNFVKKIVK